MTIMDNYLQILNEQKPEESLPIVAGKALAKALSMYSMYKMGKRKGIKISQKEKEELVKKGKKYAAAAIGTAGAAGYALGHHQGKKKKKEVHKENTQLEKYLKIIGD